MTEVKKGRLKRGNEVKSNCSFKGSTPCHQKQMRKLKSETGSDLSTVKHEIANNDKIKTQTCSFQFSAL